MKSMITLRSQQRNRFLILYGSQTGQAKAIAEEIAERSSDHGLQADVYCLSMSNKKFCLDRESCVVFVVSTTGDGDPPDTAALFFLHLINLTGKNDLLKNLNYALLALGDSSYYKFCLFGRLLEQVLQKLSAKNFYVTGYGDDAEGIETAVDPWINNLWPILQKQLGLEPTIPNVVFLPSSNFTLDKPIFQTDAIYDIKLLAEDFHIETLHAPKLPVPTISISYEEDLKLKIKYCPSKRIIHSQASPLARVELLDAKKLTSCPTVKETFELTFKFKDMNVPYVPGDAFGFICSNHLKEVQILLKRLKASHFADKPANLYINESCTKKKKLPPHLVPLMSLKEIFQHCIDIRSVPKKILLRTLAEYCSCNVEKNSLLHLSSQEGSKEYTDYIRKPSLSILDILLRYDTCFPPIEALIEHLPYLKPRFYSVSSSPLTDASTFKILFNTVKFDAEDGRLYAREGVCTGWFKDLSKNLINDYKMHPDLIEFLKEIDALQIFDELNDIYVYKKQNHHFYLPIKDDLPMIMIGPGTGVAPFLGFLEHRKQLNDRSNVEPNFSPMWLFYGCRTKNKDFLYKKEINDLKISKVLTNFSVSHSREMILPLGVTTKYVHENIRLNAHEISSIISAGGHIFVCGDAKNMTKDVHLAFIDILKSTMDITEDEAKAFVESLQKEHRYVNDVWS